MFTYPGDTTKAELLGLHPATQYNISVTPYNKFGRGRSTFLLIWTQIGGNFKIITWTVLCL